MAIALIVAGGEGLRMAGKVKKQYIELCGRPILSRTLRVFDACADIDRTFLVVPEGDIAYCRKQILMPFKFRKEIRLVSGGTVRQDSVYNGLKAIERSSGFVHPNDIVAIHDGVRPFVTAEQIRACIDNAKSTGACILGIPVEDTVKRLDASGNIDATLERSEIWLAQTPQVFRFNLIQEAYRKAWRNDYQATDDACLVEHLGKPVCVIPGSRSNMKITHPEDLTIAAAIARSIASET